MITLRQSGLHKVKAGVTTSEEVVRGDGEGTMATLPELLKTHGRSQRIRPAHLDVHAAADPCQRTSERLVHSLNSVRPGDQAAGPSVLTDSQKKRFEETQELDFSFGIRDSLASAATCSSARRHGRGLPSHSEKVREASPNSRRSVEAKLASVRAASCSSRDPPAAASRQRSRDGRQDQRGARTTSSRSRTRSIPSIRIRAVWSTSAKCASDTQQLRQRAACSAA